MGNTNQPGRGSGDLGSAAMKGWPVLFHNVHSENVQLTPDRRKAKRVESFCKGICFSDRPILVNERVYLKFSEVSTSWSGVVRFGFMSHDPATLNAAELPRYACPDLTNKPGYWAKALPERFAEQGLVLFYYVNRGGDVMFGINGEEKGVFFSGVATNVPLYGLVDIYGNSTAVEFIDGRQLNNLSPNAGLAPGGTVSSPDLTRSFQQQMTFQEQSVSMPPSPYNAQSASMPAIGGDPSASVPPPAAQGLAGLPTVRYHTQSPLFPLPFHKTIGRNVCLSTDKTIAARLVEEYCNAYVFSQRPLQCAEKLVIQILAIDKAYVGGLAFGMTAADPNFIKPEDLPDDSDILLDRPEYWIVNKDVCALPEIGDELSFHLTEEGEVRYGKNGHTIATLMHIDKTLPMWPFFDVYGSTQKIKSLGVMIPGMSTPDRGGLTVALPPPRSQGSSPVTNASGITPPPRPPPPRTSPGSMRGSPSSGRRADAPTPPSLPPKQHRPAPQPPPSSVGHHHGPPPSLPPPLIPTPVSAPSTPMSKPGQIVDPITPPNSQPPPQTPPRLPQPRSFPPPSQPPPQLPPHHGLPVPVVSQVDGRETDEALDNATNECSVCLESAVDCVLYTCGHMCMCYKCAVDIKDRQGALCPICRQTIKDIIRIYRT